MPVPLLNSSTAPLRGASIRSSHSGTATHGSLQPSSVHRRASAAPRLLAARSEADRPLTKATPIYAVEIAAAEKQSVILTPEAPSVLLEPAGVAAQPPCAEDTPLESEPSPCSGSLLTTCPLASSSSRADSAASPALPPLPPLATEPSVAQGSDATLHACMTPLPATLTPSARSVSSMCARDHNSVTIKANTNVKDAAGAICKVLGRMPSALITALRLEATHDALNRAIKSIAVARKYINDELSGHELTFLPMNRSNADGVQDSNLFAFLCFKTQLAKGLKLLDQDQTDLNVSRGSNANHMANAIIHIIKDRHQAVMKAGGAKAIFIALSALVNARRRLKRSHHMDIMTVPSWITEDTVGTLGRESKFLRFNILPCLVNGPLDLSPAPA